MYICEVVNLQDTFDFLNKLFLRFYANEELAILLDIENAMAIKNIPEMEAWDAKARRTFADSTLITTDELSFFDFSFTRSNSTMKNHMFNKEMLEFNIYVPRIDAAEAIYKVIKKILKLHYKDMHCTTPCQSSCSIAGIYRYSFIAKPIVSS
jgi:hypothetical protein